MGLRGVIWVDGEMRVGKRLCVVSAMCLMGMLLGIHEGIASGRHHDATVRANAVGFGLCLGNVLRETEERGKSFRVGLESGLK